MGRREVSGGASLQARLRSENVLAKPIFALRALQRAAPGQYDPRDPRNAGF
jgi:hypothetical protein